MFFDTYNVLVGRVKLLSTKQKINIQEFNHQWSSLQIADHQGHGRPQDKFSCHLRKKSSSRTWCFYVVNLLFRTIERQVESLIDRIFTVSWKFLNISEFYENGGFWPKFEKIVIFWKFSFWKSSIFWPQISCTLILTTWLLSWEWSWECEDVFQHLQRSCWKSKKLWCNQKK